MGVPSAVTTQSCADDIRCRNHQGEPVLAEVTALACRLVGGRRASLMLPSGKGWGELSVVAAAGLPIPLDATTPRRLGEPVAGHVAQSHQPLLVAERGTQSGQYGHYESGSFICIPIVLGDTCGVLSVADPLGNCTFDQGDLALLQSLAIIVVALLPQIEAQQRVQRMQGVINELRRQVVNTQETERQRLARDIHDEVGHALIEAIFSLDQDASTFPPGHAAHGVMRAVRQRLVDCATTLHGIVLSLRPRLLEAYGLVAAVRYLLKQTARASGLTMEVVIAGDLESLEGDVELVIFRVIQEAMTNILKHARATTVRVQLERRPDRLVAIIEDDGVGLDTRILRPGSLVGHGVTGMRERVEMLGGNLEVGRAFSGGTRLVAWVPA